jgi:spermidine synthase
MQPLVVLFLFFITGAVGLAFEVLWIRMLVNIFGVTVHAVSTVISSFFAGLALGSYLFGKLGEKTKNPLYIYSMLEFGVGIYALATLVLFTKVDAIWTTIYSAVGGDPFLYSLARFAICFIILLVPTTLMGGTLPILSKYFSRNLERVGRSLGLIYSANTFGAVVGSFLVGFVFIRTIGIRHTLYAGVACNMLVALFAFLMGSTKGRYLAPVMGAAGNKSDSAAFQGGVIGPGALKLVLVAFALSGFASLSYELLWTRILVYFLGVQTYAFTTMLVTFLLGIAIGSAVFSRFIDSIKDNVWLFGAVEIGIGLSSLAALLSMGYMSSVTAYLAKVGFVRTWWHLSGLKFILAAMFMFIPTFLMGSTFPIVSRIFVNNLKHVSTKVGKIYALNTVGGIIGSALTGFFLLPLLGIRGNILIIVALNIALGLALILIASKRRGFLRRAALVTGIVVLLPVVPLACTNRPILRDWNVHHRGAVYDILYCNEGIECTLSVLRNKKTDLLELNINGQSTAYTSYRDIQVHKMLVHYPMLLHPDPREVLVIGFGMGVTSYGATLYDNANVTCVELVKDEIEASPYFDEINHGVIESPKLNFIHGDGRNYIHVVDRQFDIITFNAIHPRLSPTLYTKDFYEKCKTRMKPDGIICAWVPSNWITQREFRSLVNTFVDVFPQSTLWFSNPDHVLLIAGLEKPEIDFDLVRRKIAEPEIFNHLGSSNLGNPFSFIGMLTLGPEGLKEYTKDSFLVTDNHPQIEFSRCHYTGLNKPAWNHILSVREHYINELPDLVKTSSIDDRRAISRNLKSLEPFIKGQLLADEGLEEHKEALQEYEKAHALARQNDNIIYWWAVSKNSLKNKKSVLQQKTP